MIHRLRYIFYLILLIILLQYCDDVPIVNNNNYKPTIESIIAEPNIILPNTFSNLRCIASDPDNDELDYIWITDEGSISGYGDTVTWHSPKISGDYFIKCKVIDSNGAFAIDSVMIKILTTLTNVDTSIRHIEITNYYISSDSLKIDSLFFEWWFRVGQVINVYFEFRSKAKYHVEGANCNILEEKGRVFIPNYGSWLSGYSNFTQFYLQEGVCDSIGPGGGVRLYDDRGLPPFSVNVDFYIKGEFVSDTSSTQTLGEFELSCSESILIPAFE